jgi:prepilin-type N-terminal cleavage/methylation domain-containing protein
MKTSLSFRRPGFTLLETVIAIGVLAVLLTGFMVVFAPAADGIRKSINIQQADRLASTLERELVTLRDTNNPTGFDKAFEWIKASNAANEALLVYQYRGRTGSLRPDGTPTPEPMLKDKLVGKDYVVVPMVRRKNDANFRDDLNAIEGAVYLVKCTQLVFGTDGLTLGSPGVIRDPKGTATSATSNDYPEAVIAFSAEFFMLPAKTADYFNGAFNTRFAQFKNPVFTRNLAVRR